MYLKSLTCKGFKSFADRAVISLEPGITAIIGPNGSGKSNVLDAVLWVLGERNARNLRGQAMEDVIFAGSSTRRHVSMAEVVLVLDNSDGTLPVDYDEVSITRRMYRSGESEYLINGTACRRMDVLDILHDSGLGAGTHSIISQGHLDSVLQSRPEDRRDLIEEAAGVLKHKQRKARSERKLERMDQHLLRIRDISREVERQLKPLERKAKRAVTYENLAAELAEVTLDLAVDDLRVLQNRWDTVVANETALDAEVSQKQQEVAAADEQMQRLQSELQQQAEGAGAVADDLQRISRASEQLDSTMLLLREKKRSGLRLVEEKRLQLDADAARLASAREASKAAEESFQEVAQRLGAARENLQRLATERDEVSKAFADMRREQGESERREATLVRDIDRLRAAKDKTADALSSGMADSKLLASQVEDVKKRLAATEQRATELGEELEQAQAALAEATSADEACRARSGELLVAVDAARIQLQQAREAEARTKAQVTALEESERALRASNKALTWALDSREKLGASKLLLEELSIPADSAAVVEQLLADSVDALLLADAQAATDALSEVLAAAAEGTVSMLALQGFEAPHTLACPAGAAAVPLMDAVSCSDEVRQALQRLLGDVLLCETIDDARACAALLAKAKGKGSWRVASKDGCIITSTGLHRVSRAAQDSVGALERHRELDEARALLKRQAKEARSCADALEELEAQLREVQKESLERTSARAQAQGSCDALAAQASAAQADLAQQQAERRELEERQQSNAELLQQMRPDAERIESELASLSAELTTLRQSLATLREDLQPLRRRSGMLNDEHTEARLEVGKLTERESYAKRMLEGYLGDIARLEQQIARAERDVAASKRFDAVDAVVESLMRVRSTVGGRLQAIERKADEFRSGTASLHGRADAKRQESLVLRGALDEAVAKLSDTRVQKGRLEVQVEAAIATIKEECATPLESALQRAQLEDRPAAEERAASLQRRIASLGPINPDAAREYAELQERHTYLQGQVTDMLEARRALGKIVAAIDARMRDDFIQTFKEVDESFQQIFSQLFPGGSAKLSLVDESDPEHSGVEVTAQPRGKRIAKMSLMSGGEKSLTALALLFAVYATRPTPFYILDEVEAALDDTNLRRLCAFLDDLRARTQLIMITHQRRTMEMADVLYGVSMQSDGVTRVISQKLDRTQQVQEG